MKKQESLFGKRELILIGTVITVILAFWIWNRFLFSAPASRVEVSVVDTNSNKQVIETFLLSEDTAYTIQTADGGINELVIRDGNVWISDANCPNHDCVKKGKISRNGEMLVCIPHRLTVAVIGES